MRDREWIERAETLPCKHKFVFVRGHSICCCECDWTLDIGERKTREGDRTYQDFLQMKQEEK